MCAVNSSPSSAVKGKGLLLGLFLTFCGGAGWGFSGTCAQYLFEYYDVSPTWLMATRSCLAACIYLPLLLCMHKEERALIRDTPNLIQTGLFALFGIFAVSLCYLNSIQASNAGCATILQALNLLFILAVTCFQLRRKPSRKETLGLVLALLGTFLLATHGSFTSLSLTPAALGWGLANAFTCALYTLLPAKPLATHNSVVVTGTATIIVGILAFLVFRPLENMPQLDAFGWFIMFVIVVVGTLGAFIMYMSGVKRVGCYLAGLLACSEPLVACLLSVVWLGSVFAPIDIVGCALIIIMMFLMV